MKKRAILAGLGCWLIVLCGCNKSSDLYKAGTYTATESGYGGPVTVSVVFDSASMLSVTVVENNETNWFIDRVINILPDKIIKTQTYDVDAFSGATVTSEAVKGAVKNCMEQALVKQPD
jgi:fumarate reductase flavoprotein subunit